MDSFNEHRDFLIALATKRLPRRLRGRLDPEDIVQEAALSLLRAKAEYDPTLGPYQAYLATVVNRRVQEACRNNFGSKRNPKKEETISTQAGYEFRPLVSDDLGPDQEAQANEYLAEYGQDPGRSGCGGRLPGATLANVRRFV